MTKYIMPIIKDKKRREQEKNIRMPLHKMPPLPPPSRGEDDEKDDDIDKTIVDFNIDGNISEISIKV